MKMGFMKNTFSKLQSKAEEAMLRRLKTQTKKAFRRQLLFSNEHKHFILCIVRKASIVYYLFIGRSIDR